MNGQWRWGVVVASVLMAAACTEDDGEGMDAGVDAGGGSDAGPSGATVVSDDGLATLFIPDGALPEGVTADMISITALDPESAGSRRLNVTAEQALAGEWTEADEIPPVLAYRLEPSGTTFAEPLVATIRLEGELSSGGGMVTLASMGQVESLAIAGIRFPEPTVKEVDVLVPHFSGLDVWRAETTGARDLVTIEVPSPSDGATYGLGESFPVVVELTRTVGRTRSWVSYPDLSVGDDYPPTLVIYRSVPGTWHVTPHLVQEGALVPAGWTDRSERAVTGDTTTETFESGCGSVAGEGRTSPQIPVRLVVERTTAVLEGLVPGEPSSPTYHDHSEHAAVWRTIGCTDAGPLDAGPPPDAGSGMSCTYWHECGGGRYCGGDMLCHEDTSSSPCTKDADCTTTRHPVCVDSDGELRCANCRTAADCPSSDPACVNNHCEQCDVDADCTDTGICGPAKTCIECETPTDCGAYPGRPNCTSDGRCVQCASDAECTGALAHCGADGTCTECTDDTHCAAPLPVCRNGRCNRCQSSSDCPSNALPSCQHSGCNRCTADFSCSGSYTCETGAYPGRICTTGCTVDGDCDATRGEICAGGECRQCMVDADCPAAAPHCDSGNCYECRVQADCPSPLICDTGNGRCIPCAASADCTSPGLPRCVFNACDGCISDADCPDARFPGLTHCNTVDGSCEAP